MTDNTNDQKLKSTETSAETAGCKISTTHYTARERRMLDYTDQVIHELESGRREPQGLSGSGKKNPTPSR